MAGSGNEKKQIGRRPFEALYVHVPFCAGTKCAYCAFYSIPAPPRGLVDAYAARIERSLEQADFERPLDSVYIGGGTPTALPADAMARLFDAVGKHAPLAENAEISVECNPETLTPEKAAVLGGFANRVSLGVQSFDEKTLELLGRRGSPEDFERATALLRSAGIAELGCDLIHSVPGQTLDEWRNDLERAADSGVSHVSTYSLTIEEGTALAERAEPPDPDTDAAMWELSGEILEEKGFRRYEVSNFAIPGAECRHNLEVWFGGTLLGLGPAAASFDGVDRWTENADIAEWLENAPPEIDAVSAERRADEIFSMGMRAARGWTDALAKKRTGFGLERWNAALAELAENGLVSLERAQAAPTAEGMELWDTLAERLLLDDGFERTAR